MASLFAQGDAVTADKLNGAQAAYAIAWTSTGTAPNLGNGTLTGVWSRIGDIMFISAHLLFGTTTTSGTGTWLFSLPIAAKSTTSIPQATGEARALDSGISFYRGLTMLNSSTTFYISGKYDNWLATVPFTWGNLDEIIVSAWFPVG